MAPNKVTAAMIARSRTVAEPRWSPGGGLIGWIDGFDGRYDLVIARSDGSVPPIVVTPDVPLTPVGGYGGGAWAWASDDEVVIAGSDGRLLVVRADGGGVVRVLARDGMAGAPAVTPDGTLAAFICERGDACDVAVVPVDGSAWPVRASRADFAWDPAWSPDGQRLAWHEWDLPAMPWEASRLAVAAVDRGGRVDAPRVIAGAAPSRIGLGQPRFSPDGSRIAYVSDADGPARVIVARRDGSRPVALRTEAYEHAPPSWSPGLRTFAWSPDGGAIAYARNESGFGRLVRASRRGTATTELGKGFHLGIDWSPHGIAAVRSGAVTPPQVVVVDPRSGARRALARGPMGGFEACGLVEPAAVRWRSGSATVHGLLYRPERGRGAGGRRSAPPPLLVLIHGGPTDQARADWNPRVAYWVSRGWAVLAANYRGSSGYGRAYREALDGKWGIHDVNDVAAGIRHAGREGWCDPARVAVMGGSAGGYTVLLLCIRHGDLIAAGVSLFGVADLMQLAATTHRFESRYLDSLVGELPRHAARYAERSPLTYASSIAVPLLVLQGRDDKVVPVDQADAMVAAIRNAGGEVEYHVYEGEGHGFRRLTNVVDEYERTERFLTRHVLGATA
ncbi:MAG TPA: S9 family peptidase [Acidimicrobiia bacterium]|jgi:dipeptidyl aminopeptidase/acylaminoacyl peptidase